MFFDECQQLFHIASRADASALKSQILAYRCGDRNRRSWSIQKADQGNMSSPRRCLNGPGDSVPSDDVKDMVGALSIRKPERGLIPCCVHTRINNLCGSQLFQARNLAGASGSY